MSTPIKPFTPGQPTVYTPKKKSNAPPQTDLAADPNNRDLPVDLTTGQSVSEEDTKEMMVDIPADPRPSSNRPGEDRRSQK